MYKNLIYANDLEYDKLVRKRMKVESIADRQKYYLLNNVRSLAANAYIAMYKRCYECEINHWHINSYKGATMCAKWKSSKKAFYKWYADNYYECDGERMALDKDLLCPGNKEYGQIQFCGSGKQIKLSYWDTPEALLRVEIKPFVEE